MTDKIWFQRMALTITVAGAAMMLFMSFLWLYPSTPIVVTQPFLIRSQVVVQGEKLTYGVKYCSDRERSYIVERKLFNVETGDLWAVADRVNHALGGCEDLTVKVQTPASLTPGEYKLVAIIRVPINIIRTFTAQYESEPFTVISDGK